MQNHRIPYTTATWGIVKDASEPAPFLSVVAARNGKRTRIVALFKRQSLQKAHKNKFIKYYIVRRHGTACQSLRWRLPASET